MACDLLPKVRLRTRKNALPAGRTERNFCGALFDGESDKYEENVSAPEKGYCKT